MQPPAFQFLGTPHLVAIALTALAPVLLIRAVRRWNSPRLARTICVALAAVLLASQISGWVDNFRLHGGEIFVREHLPLHLCGISSLLSVVVLLARHRLAYELVYFWGLAGAGNAVLTPDVVEGWPTFPFIRFFVSHGGVVVAAAFATWGLGMRPTFASLLRAWGVANLLAVVIGGINIALGANYMFLSEKPVAPSPFLLFPWPWYLLWLNLVAFVFFLLCYLPVRVENRRSVKAATG